MIASFENNLIFCKTRKTAGTSVEIVLSAWCAGIDIVTPLNPEDELVRIEYGGLPRNFGGPHVLAEGYIDAVHRRDLQEIEHYGHLLRKPLRCSGYYNHMPAVMVRGKLPHLWERAYTFAVERHPYEKVVSRANWWRRSRQDHRPIEAIIADVISDPRLSCKYIYTDGDNLIVDAVLEYESLWDRIGELAARAGKSLPAKLPSAKGYTRKDTTPAREMLTNDQRRTIRHKCAFEFELMKYEP